VYGVGGDGIPESSGEKERTRTFSRVAQSPEFEYNVVDLMLVLDYLD